MGIRFYCPKGHKLNVKEFQAGRRGICPFCGARILIPTQSTRPASKSAKRQAPAQDATYSLDPDEIDDSSPDILPGEPPSLPGDPAGGKMLGPSRPVGTPAVGDPVIAPPTLPASDRGAAATPTTAQPTKTGAAPSGPARLLSPAAAPKPQQPVAAAPAPAVLANGAPGPTAGSVPAAPAGPQPAVAKPATAEPADPIAEAPEMIWYVRPPSGGQFGPAAGELMRTWLSEGRVSADSLIWREGWRDWREAATVFPKLRGNQIMDFLETTPVVHVAAVSEHAHRPKVKPSSDRNQIVLLAVLSAVVVVLLAILLLVLFHQ